MPELDLFIIFNKKSYKIVKIFHSMQSKKNYVKYHVNNNVIILLLCENVQFNSVDTSIYSKVLHSKNIFIYFNEIVLSLNMVRLST